MNARAWMGVIGALAIVVLALWLWRGRGEGGAAIQRTDLAPRIDPAAAGLEEPRAAAPVEALPHERESPQVQREVPAPGSSVLLLAVARESGLPVPEADVWYGPPSLFREHGARQPTAREDVLRRLGHHARTDERGQVLLPAEGYASVTVRKEDLHGAGDFYFGNAGSTVRATPPSVSWPPKATPRAAIPSAGANPRSSSATLRRISTPSS